MSWDGFLSTSGLLAHVAIYPMEQNEEAPKVEEAVKESMRDRRATSKGKGKTQVAHEETQLRHRPRTRYSTKKLSEEPTYQNTIDLLGDIPSQGVGGE